MPLLALTRPVPPSLAQCQLTHLSRTPIDIPRAIAQHAAYEDLLRSLGAQVCQVSVAPDLPDSVFIEDTAVVLDEVAIMTNPGAVSRALEVNAVAEVLAQHRNLEWLRLPATLDGGDVLLVPQTRMLYVGRSSRTNEAGIKQLQRIVEPHGYHVIPLPLRDCLHLKSAATQVAPRDQPPVLLINPHWLPAGLFSGIACIPIHPAEPYAANALRIGGTLLLASQFPMTRHILHLHGMTPLPIDNDELAKAEGALTCCSLVFETP